MNAQDLSAESEDFNNKYATHREQKIVEKAIDMNLAATVDTVIPTMK